MVGDVTSVVQALVNNIDQVVRGKHHEIRMAVCCLLTEGHLLVDDVPGTGKTTLAKAIAGSIAGSWKLLILLDHARQHVLGHPSRLQV